MCLFFYMGRAEFVSGVSGSHKTKSIQAIAEEPAQYIGNDTAFSLSIGGGYRGLTYLCALLGVPPTNDGIKGVVKNANYGFVNRKGVLQPSINGRPIPDRILMSPEVARRVATYANKTAAKDFMNQLRDQTIGHALAAGVEHVLIDARGEHGKVNAQQIYVMPGILEERAERRYQEHIGHGHILTREENLQLMRDKDDKDREAGILTIPTNADIVFLKGGANDLAKNIAALITKKVFKLTPLSLP
jgi:cytidylate kinase